MTYRVLVEGEERILDDYVDVIDHVQTNVHFEVDEQDMANWLPQMYISEKVFMRDDCLIERIK
ncbi:hypothetical protein MHB43_10205 [Paenibacillus sp. FSL H8-0317]|uniref:hypothetical protein n=1 Tax=Paenibacillus sp. FSL H8-0317 TaxID=2921385 RepID=UPI00324D87CF